MSEKQKRSGEKYGRPIRDSIMRGVHSPAGTKEGIEGASISTNKRIQALYQQSLGGSSNHSNDMRNDHTGGIPVPTGGDNSTVPVDSGDDQPNRSRGTGNIQESLPTDTPTLNDVNELMQVVREALNDQRTHQWRNPRYRSPMISPIVDQLRNKLITMNSVILPPLIQSQLGHVLAPIREQAEAVGDPYFGLVMEDLSQGRVDRLDKLMWLSGVNQIRLKIAQEDMFEEVNEYIKTTYASDPTNPEDPTFFIPAETEAQLEETWKRVHELIDAGLAMIRETIQFKVAGESHELTILTIASNPIASPSSSIMDIGK